MSYMNVMQESFNNIKYVSHNVSHLLNSHILRMLNWFQGNRIAEYKENTED